MGTGVNEYLYCMDKGGNEAAKIGMTHSYVRIQDEFDFKPDRRKRAKILIDIF